MEAKTFPAVARRESEESLGRDQLIQPDSRAERERLIGPDVVGADAITEVELRPGLGDELRGETEQERVAGAEVVVGFEVDGGLGDEVASEIGEDDVAGAEVSAESDTSIGLGGYVDAETATLRMQALVWKDVQTTRKAIAQRGGDPALVELLAQAEKKASAALTRALRKHPLWPWLSQYPGLGGAHVALVLGAIRDPRRFPGQQCAAGHYHPAILEVGETCGWEMANGEVCEEPIGPVRRGSGSRPLWKYLGLSVGEDGRMLRKRKGQRCCWDPIARSSFMQPDGICDQIVRSGVRVGEDGERYALHPAAAMYLAKKASLKELRGAERSGEIAADFGPADIEAESDGRSGGAEARSGIDPCDGPVAVADGRDVQHGGVEAAGEIDGRFGPAATRAESDTFNGGAGISDEIEGRSGLAPWEIEKRARVYAAKQWVADLLQEWKRISGADSRSGSARTSGPADLADAIGGDDGGAEFADEIQDLNGPADTTGALDHPTGGADHASGRDTVLGPAGRAP